MEEWRPEVAVSRVCEPRASDWDYKHPKFHTLIAMNDLIELFPKFPNQCGELSMVLMHVVFVRLPIY